MVSVRTALKKSFEQMYVPQERQPFIYMSLELDPRNVQPAKHEVHFLHEDSVIDKVRSAVESKLLGCNAARKFYAQDEINNGLETLLSRQCHLEAKLRGITKYCQIVHSDAQKLAEMITFTSTLAENVSAKVGPLDIARSQQRVQICSCVVTGCRLLFEMKIMRKQQPMYIAFFQWINIF